MQEYCTCPVCTRQRLLRSTWVGFHDSVPLIPCPVCDSSGGCQECLVPGEDCPCCEGSGYCDACGGMGYFEDEDAHIEIGRESE